MAENVIVSVPRPERVVMSKGFMQLPAPGALAAYHDVWTTPTTFRTFVHNAGRKPRVQFIAADGTEYAVTPFHQSDFSFTLTFSVPLAGEVFGYFQ